MKIFPAWNPSSGDHSSGGRNASKQPQESLNLSSNSWHRDVSGCPSKSKGHQGVVSDFNVETQVGAQSEKGELYVNSHGTSHHVTFASPLHLALVDDGKSQGSVVSRVMDENACIKIENSFVCFDDHINDGFTKSCSTNISEMDFRYLFHDKWTTSRENSIDVPECVPSNEYGKDSEITYSDIDRISRGMSLSSGFFSSLIEKDEDMELKLELKAIELQYQQCFQELSTMKEEELENCRKRWMTKKKLAGN